MAGGDFSSVDFVAAESSSYNHATGGGAFDDDTSNVDTVEQLEGGDFADGDIVTFFTVLNLQDGADDQTVRLTYNFGADSNGQSGAGYTEVVGVSINRSPIEDLLEADTTEDGIFESDPDSTAILVSDTLDTGDVQFQGGTNSNRTAIVDVTGLDVGETVIVRIDVRLEVEDGSSPGGNLDARLTSAAVISDPDDSSITPDNPSSLPGSGAQTITLKQVDDIAVGEPILNIVKTADVTSVDAAGDEITYTYAVTNSGDAQATSVTVVDDNATPGNGSDDFNPTFVGGDTDGDGNLDFGETWIYEETVSVTQDQIDSGVDIVNIATADSAETDPVTDDAIVDVIQNALLSIDKMVVDSDNDGLLWNDDDGDGLPDAGETIDYSIKVTNDGNVTLTNVTVEDPMLGIDVNVGDLAVGAMTTVNDSYTLTQDDINAGEKVNTARADSNETDPEEDTETVLLPQNPDVNLVKEVELTIDVDQSQDVSAGDELTYTFTIENTGNVTLTYVEIADPLPGLSAIDFGSFYGTLDPGETVTGTAAYTVTADDVESGDINNKATVTAEAPGGDPEDPNDDVTDTDTAEVDVPQPQLEIDKMFVGFVDNDGNGEVTQGDILNYDVKVSSTGTANLTDVTVTDPLTGLDETIDFLAAGTMQTFSTSYTVTEQDALTGQVLNTAVADSTQTDPEDDSEDVPVKLAVEIDIKPGSFPSSFNLKGNGIVPVAIFSTDGFDATTITTVTLEEFLPEGPPDGTATTTSINFDDVNNDGLLDAVAQFRKPTLIGVLDTDSEFAKLTGMTSDGTMFVGIGDVNVTQI